MEWSRGPAPARSGGACQTSGGHGGVSRARAGDVGPPSEGDSSRPVEALGFPSRVAVALLDFYKRWLSPLLPRACRFTPTCSRYARLAIVKHGLLKGSVMAVWRILRCNPFNPGGVDYP